MFDEFESMGACREHGSLFLHCTRREKRRKDRRQYLRPPPPAASSFHWCFHSCIISCQQSIIFSIMVYPSRTTYSDIFRIYKHIYHEKRKKTRNCFFCFSSPHSWPLSCSYPPSPIITTIQIIIKNKMHIQWISKALSIGRNCHKHKSILPLLGLFFGTWSTISVIYPTIATITKDMQTPGRPTVYIHRTGVVIIIIISSSSIIIIISSIIIKQPKMDDSAVGRQKLIYGMYLSTKDGEYKSQFLLATRDALWISFLILIAKGYLASPLVLIICNHSKDRM